MEKKMSAILYGEPKVGRTKFDDGTGFDTPLQVSPLSDEIAPKMTESFEQLVEALQQGQAAVQELALLKPALALAISKLPRKQLKIDAHAELGEWVLQGKTEGNGATILRAVRA